MCGILCLVRRGRPVDRSRFEASLARLRHRGPDAIRAEYRRVALGPGEFVEVALGHTRLAIIDPGSRSEQPFAVGENRLVFNGEIYNHREVAELLPSEFRQNRQTDGDTEVLARLLADRAPEALAAANGMWAFCWLDATAGKLTAGRDRYGKKPLFYIVRDDTLAFASELRPLLDLMGVPPRFVPWALPAFLAEGWCLSPSDGTTHLEGIREVRAGHVLSCDLARWTFDERRVVDRAAQASAPVSDEELAATFADAVRLRLLADRKVGLLLSGGVDSSLILSAIAHQGATDRVTCFVGDAGKSADADHARQTLRALNVPSEIVPLAYAGTSFTDFLTVCRHQEKPFPLIGNVLGLPELYRAAAALDVRVLLDGTGADELFGGYWRRYATFAVRDGEAAGDAVWLTRLRAGGSFDAANVDAGGLGPDQLEYLQPDTRRRVMTAPTRDPLTDHAGTLPEALDLDIRRGRLPEWLWQNDRNAMAASTENRSPFLDARLAAALSRSHRDAFDGPWNKPRLRRLFRFFRPLPVAERTEKQGFRWVYGRFFRSNRHQILSLIRESQVARAAVNVPALCSRASADDTFLISPVVQRVLVIAGLEREGLIEP